MTFKELLTEAGEKAQDLGKKGWEASKSLASKVGEKAQDMGERGMIAIETAQLESQAQKLFSRLGTETYRLLVEENVVSITSDIPSIKVILSELTSIREAIEKNKASKAD
jgi:hypothetical protein